MKKALLWLGPLACLALACLYAYAWFTRDPLAVAFERVEKGMTLEEAVAIMGRPADHLGQGMKVEAGCVVRLPNALWSNDCRTFQLFFADGRVVSMNIICTQQTVADKTYNWLRDWWNPVNTTPYASPPPPAPVKKEE